MSISDFLARRSLIPGSAASDLATAAWDAALCAAAAQTMDRGKPRQPSQIIAAITALHSWDTPPAPEQSPKTL